MPISPTAEGLRSTFRLPSVTLAEIAWRWIVGATAIALFFFGLFEYVGTLPVSGGDRLFLKTRQPYLIAQAIAHILRGSLSRVVFAFVVGAVLLTILWIIAASIGRIATVRALLDLFRKEASHSRRKTAFPTPVAAVAKLNFLRAAAWLAALIASFGAVIVSSFVSTDADPEPGLAFLLFLFLIGLVWLAWVVVNWILGLACMFAVRDDSSAIEAISTAVSFCRARTSAVLAVSAWTGLAHIVIFVAATIVAMIPLGFIGVLPWRLMLLLVSLITLAYFAATDWLYTVRLAGYVCIAELPEIRVAPLQPQAPPTVPLETNIDRDELILSDVSGSL